METSKAARAANDKQAEDSHAVLRGNPNQDDIIKKQADQIVELAMANRKIKERFVKIEQCFELAKPRFGHQRETFGHQRSIAFANKSNRPMGELPVLRASVFERVGCPAAVTSYPTDRALSMASSLNNLRPLSSYRHSANRRPQRGGFHQAGYEDWRRNSWAGSEWELSWREPNLAPRWREDEWIKPPYQPLRDRHPEVKELVRLPTLRPEPKIEHYPANLRPVPPVQGRGMGEEARVRLSASPLTERVLAVEFQIDWTTPKISKFEGNIDPIIYLVEF